MANKSLNLFFFKSLILILPFSRGIYTSFLYFTSLFLIIIDSYSFFNFAFNLFRLNIKKYSFDAHNVPVAPFLKDLHNKGLEVVVIGCQGKEFPMPYIKPGLSEEVSKAVDKAIDMILEDIKSKS